MADEIIQCARCNRNVAAAFVQIDTSPDGKPVLQPRCTPCLAATLLPMRFTGEVTTPAVPQQPTGPMWQKLKLARSRDGIIALRDLAERQGYAPDGQLMTAIRARLTTQSRRAAR